METAAGYGLMPNEFYRMTIGEIMVVIRGAQEKERRESVALVGAVIRGIGGTFGGNQSPYRGLVDEDDARPITPQEARQMRFWRDD